MLTIHQKYVFVSSFLLRQGQGFWLEIHNHSSHTFSLLSSAEASVTTRYFTAERKLLFWILKRQFALRVAFFASWKGNSRFELPPSHTRPRMAGASCHTRHPDRRHDGTQASAKERAFSQYSKEGKKCQNGSSFVILLDAIHARLFKV